MRIALISDIHFGKFSRSKDFCVPGDYSLSDEIGGRSLKKELINKLIEEQVMFLIIAGDLTSIGCPDEFYYCIETIKEIAKESKIDLNNVILCLGNHDIDWKISKLSDDNKQNEQSVNDKISNSYLSVACSVASHWIDDSFNYDSKGPAPFSGIKEF